MIKIAISGQIDNDTKVGYSYPHKFDPARPTPEDEWLHSVTDPRNAREFGAEEIFALWKSEHGNYYAIIFPSKDDPRNGRMMITVHVENKVFTDGSIVISTLRNLKNLVDQSWPNISETSVESIINGLEKKLSRDYHAFSSGLTNTKAYRVYKNEDELKAIMQFPNQSEYNPYKRVLIVPLTCMEFAAQYVTNYKEIQGQIRVSYDVCRALPEGVFVDKYRYNYGDEIIVYYKKTGFRTQKASFIADSKSNKYAQFNGSEILLNSAETVGVQFERCIKFEVYTNKHNIIPRAIFEGLNCTYSIDQETPSVIIFSTDIPEYKLRVSCPNYEPKELILTEIDFIKGKVQVYLNPQIYNMNLKVEKDGRTIQGMVSISSDDELYPVLSDLQRYGKRLYTTQKVVEKVIHGNERAGKSSDGHRGGVSCDHGDDHQSPSSGKGFWRVLWSWVKIPLIVLLGLYLLYCLYSIFVQHEPPLPFTYSENKSINDVAVSMEETVPEDSLVDIDVLQYMKDNDIWERPKLESSSKYVDILDYISNRQIDDAIKHTYSTQTIVPCNGYWKGGKSSFVDIIDSLKQRDDYEYRIKLDVEDAMRRCSDGNKVDLEKLVNEVVAIQKNYESSVTSSQSTSNVNKKSTTSNVETPHNSTGKPDSNTFGN